MTIFYINTEKSIKEIEFITKYDLSTFIDTNSSNPEIIKNKIKQVIGQET